MTTLKQKTAQALALPTVWERAEAYLSIDPTGRPGAPRCRTYQERYAQMIVRAHTPHEPREERGQQEVAPGSSPREGHVYEVITLPAERGIKRRSLWCSRSLRWATQDVRDVIRADKSGDNNRAIALGESYHEHVKKLHLSSRACVTIGSGGQECVDWDAYAKSYRGPAKWKNAGVLLSYPAGRTAVVRIETYRGTLAAELPLPPREATYEGLLDGDLYGLPRTIAGVDLVERYGWGTRKKSYQVTGLAVRTEYGWEHGADLDQVRAEMAKKRVCELERLAREASITVRTARKARLIGRICRHMPVTVEHARQAGYCTVGIEAFLARHSQAGKTTLSVGVLRRIGDARVEKPIWIAALECAQSGR